MVLAATPSAMLLLSCGSAAFAPPRCTPMMLAGKPALYEEGMEIIARREERMAALMDRMEGRVVLTGSATRPRRSYTLEELRAEGADRVAQRERLQAGAATSAPSPSVEYSIDELRAEGELRVATRKAYAMLLDEKREKLAQLSKRVAEATEGAPLDPLEISEDSKVAQDVSNAVALVGGLAALAGLGLEVGVAERAELAIVLGTMASVAADTDQGVVGQSMRAVGKVSSPILKVGSEAGKAAVKYSDEQDLGWKARAVFELSAEAAVRKMMGVEKPPKTKAPPPEEKKGPFGGLFGR